MKKYRFWILVAIAVLLAIWWYRSNNNNGADKDSNAKTADQNPSNGTKRPVSKTVTWKSCGGKEAVIKKFYGDAFFRNQNLGLNYRGKNGCQVLFLQAMLNAYAKSKLKNKLTIDGDFGPKTAAAVKLIFKKDVITLNDLDSKYQITKIQNFDPSMLDGNTWNLPWPFNIF